jgi:2-methylcitrate dehydratase
MRNSNSRRSDDSVQQRLVHYANVITADCVPPDAAAAARLRVIDTLGVLIGGFFDEGCRAARALAAQTPHAEGATVIGTRVKTTVDMAAFVNATTARCAEMTDTYHRHGSAGGHPSDVVTPLLAAAESVHASGRNFITAVVLAYEIYLRLSDVFPNRDFDHTNFCCIATAVGAGQLFGLTSEQLAECIAMAAVPNVSLRQARMGDQSIWRAAASGQAGRAGVFAAQLARAGIEGARMPFEGKAGWCDHVARTRFSLPEIDFAQLKIGESRFKYRASSGNTIACVLAAEHVAPLRDAAAVERVVVETYGKAVETSGIGEHNTNPTSHESADHSIPYLVATTLLDGTVTPRSFGEGKLRNPVLRELMRRIEVVEDPQLTARSERETRYGLARVHVIARDGERLTGDAGAAQAEGHEKSEQEKIVDKFRTLTLEYLGARRVESIEKTLLALEEVEDASVIPPQFVLA